MLFVLFAGGSRFPSFKLHNLPQISSDYLAHAQGVANGKR